MKISVIIPTCNSAARIREALDKWRSQAPAPGEITIKKERIESISGQKSPAPAKQEIVSEPGLLAERDANTRPASSAAISEKPLTAPAPSFAEGKLKAGALPVPRIDDSLSGASYAVVPEKETGRAAATLRKTAEISADKKSGFLVIRNKTEWEKAWNSQNTSQNLSLPLPEVDFKKQMVVALPTNQAGDEYKIVKTEEKPDRIIVQYRTTRPAVDRLLSSGAQPEDGNASNLSVQEKVRTIPPYQLEIVNIRPNVELQKLD